MRSTSGEALPWRLSAIFDSYFGRKPTIGGALLLLPCPGWEGKGRREFEVQVMTHFGAFLLGAALRPAVQPAGCGVRFGGRITDDKRGLVTWGYARSLTGC